MSGSTKYVGPRPSITVKGISQMDGAFKGADKQATGVTIYDVTKNV